MFLKCWALMLVVSHIIGFFNEGLEYRKTLIFSSIIWTIAMSILFMVWK